MAAWIKMPLGMELGLDPGDFVLDGNPAPSPKRGRSPQIFGPCLFCPNGWMDQDGTEIGLSSGDFVLDGDTAPLPENGADAGLLVVLKQHKRIK